MTAFAYSCTPVSLDDCIEVDSGQFIYRGDSPADPRNDWPDDWPNDADWEFIMCSDGHDHY